PDRRRHELAAAELVAALGPGDVNRVRLALAPDGVDRAGDARSEPDLERSPRARQDIGLGPRAAAVVAVGDKGGRVDEVDFAGVRIGLDLAFNREPRPPEVEPSTVR